MPDYQTIKVETSERVTRVTLNRPEIRNAFNDTMIRELREAFTAIEQDDSTRVVIFTGAGKAFCAGADLHWMRKVTDYTYEQNYEDSFNLARLMRQIYDCPKPVLGRINGAAIGGGTGLVAVCDIPVASEAAVLSFSEVKIGLVPACISPYVLKRVGERYGREYFLTGERLTAQKALQCGLVNRVVPADELDATVEGLVKQLVSSGPAALATCKRMVREVGDMDLDTAGPATAEMIARLRMSAEGQEGMAAFLERRKPAWRPG